MDTRNWEQILDGLRVPFSVEVVAWKPQTISRERKRCLAVPYVDTQPYQERLDEVCPEWQDDYAIWFSDPQEALGRGGEKRVISGKVFVKCRLTIVERTRSDVGECELTDENALTSAKAQAFKRACAAFGLGRYLYDLPKPWVDYDGERGITEVELKKLEGLLRRLAGTGPAHAQSTAASEAEDRSSFRRAAGHTEPATRPVAVQLQAEASGQGPRATTGTNGFATRPPGDTNGSSRQMASGGTRSAVTASRLDGDLRRPPSAPGRAPGPGAGTEAGQAAPDRHPNETGLTRKSMGEPPGSTGSVDETDRPAQVRDSAADTSQNAGQPATEALDTAQQDRQAAVPEEPGHEITLLADDGRAHAASNSERSADETGGPKPAKPSSRVEERREAPKSLARKKATEGASMGKAALTGGVQLGDSSPSTTQSGAVAISAATDEGEGPVLCPIHNVPLQLLVTREGKALLLHKIEGGDASSPGYCNGQEVRQVARG